MTSDKKKCCFFVPLSNASNQTETKDNVCQRRDTVIKISVTTHTHAHTHTHTHTHLTALCPGLPGWAGTRKVKPIWILLEQETVSGSAISWTICKSAPCSRQITMPSPNTQFFTGRMPFLPPNQQHQSTEGYSVKAVSLQNAKLTHREMPVAIQDTN